MRAVVPVVLAATLLLVAGPASAAGRSEVASMCTSRMLMSAADCACIAGRAMTDLDATQRAYIVLPPTDFARSSAAAEAMTPAQVAGIDAFMREVPDACRAGN